jgi:PAS domain S-box-containing protein
MKGLRRGKHIEHYETTRVRKDGHRIDISVTVSPVKNKAGSVVGASVIARDITDRKRIEMALRQSEERFRVALKNAPVRVFNQDLDLRFTWINSHIMAWAKQDCLGKTDADIVGGQEGARLMAFKKEVLRTGRGARTESEVTVDGEKFYFNVVAEPLRDVNGTIVGLTCSATDITSTKKSLLEREVLIAKLQDALEEVKLLSGLLSICASCKKITNERGDWEPMESYLQTHSQAKFSHGLCPDCLRKLYPEQYREWEQEVVAGTSTGNASDIREARLRDDRTKK